MHNRFLMFIIFLFGAASGFVFPMERVLDLGGGRTVFFEYKENDYQKVVVRDNGKFITDFVMKIPKGRDPKKIGVESYMGFAKDYLKKDHSIFPVFFVLRSNSGSADGQCGTGLELWLKVFTFSKKSLDMVNDILVQSCSNDMYLLDDGSGDFMKAFQWSDGAVLVNWMSHPSNNGNGYSSKIFFR